MPKRGQHFHPKILSYNSVPSCHLTECADNRDNILSERLGSRFETIIKNSDHCLNCKHVVVLKEQERLF